MRTFSFAVTASQVNKHGVGDHRTVHPPPLIVQFPVHPGSAGGIGPDIGLHRDVICDLDLDHRAAIGAREALLEPQENPVRDIFPNLQRRPAAIVADIAGIHVDRIDT